jgi:hypothetical protein
MLGLVEDARVEALAVNAFPGLRQLWVSQLPADPALGDRAGPLMDRIARALIDDAYVDPHPLVAQARAGFAADVQFLSTPEGAHALGIALAARCAELGIAYHTHTDRLTSPYRDDNRYLWEPKDAAEQLLLALGQQPQTRKYVSIMEMINEVEVETAGDDAQEVWVLATELYDDDGVTFNEREGKEPVASPVHYHEWDYQTQLERPAWTTVLEKRPKAGDPAVIDAMVEKHKPIVARLRHLIESMQPQGVVRTSRQEDGEEIDLNAAVRALTDLRMGFTPDPRIAIRIQRKVRDLSVLLLIDLSESTNDRIRDAGTDTTVLDLAREATALLAGALAKIGDPFAIHGFDSNGRHAVQYYRFKDFDADYDDKVKARLAGMTGQVSTRMGTAMRHAGALLQRQPSHKKLLLVLTDGEPADNDVRDPQYLRFDAKRAVEELGRSGIHSYCLTLDPYADQYVARIFGARNYMVLDHVARLPEKLSMLYLGLTR